jgi:methyl-accepting chemotaxis protein
MATIDSGYLSLSVDALRAAGFWEDDWADDPTMFFDNIRQLATRPPVADDSAARLAALEDQLAALSLKVETGVAQQADALGLASRELHNAVHAVEARVDGVRDTAHTALVQASNAQHSSATITAQMELMQNDSDDLFEAVLEAQKCFKSTLAILQTANQRAESEEARCLRWL